MTGQVSFIEFGGRDAMTARTFYGKLFGWSFEPGPGGEGYAIDGVGVPAGVHGGDEGASPYVFFRVDDLEAAVAAVERLGGTRRGHAGRRRRGDRRDVRRVPAVPRRPGVAVRPAPSAAALKRRDGSSRPAQRQPYRPPSAAVSARIDARRGRPPRGACRRRGRGTPGRSAPSSGALRHPTRRRPGRRSRGRRRAPCSSAARPGSPRSGCRDDRDGAVLAAPVALLVRHPGPHDLARVGLAVARGRVREADVAQPPRVDLDRGRRARLAGREQRGRPPTSAPPRHPTAPVAPTSGHR